MAGDTETGVCIMRMEAGLDTGPVYRQAATPITPQTTGKALHDTLAELGAQTLLAALDPFDPAACVAQDDRLATYADKLTSADTALDFREPATRLARRINALNDRLPARAPLAGETVQLLRAVGLAGAEPGAVPGTLLSAPKGRVLVACGDGILELLDVRLTRGKGLPMAAADARNGYPALFAAGQRFETLDA